MLHRKIKTSVLIAGALISGLAFFPSIAQAQISVSPLSVQTQAEKGQAQGVFSLTNNGSEPFRARLYTAPFTYTEEGFKLLESSPDDLTPFLTFSPMELEIKPGETRRVRFIARFLPSTNDGEYRATIFTEGLEAVPTGSSGNMTFGIIPRMGVNLYVVKGNLTPQLTVVNATYDTKQKSIILEINNTGGATARPRIPWTLSNAQGEVTKGHQDMFTVIAQGKRKIEIKEENLTKLSPGEYELKGELIWTVSNQNEKLPFSVKVTVP